MANKKPKPTFNTAIKALVLALKETKRLTKAFETKHEKSDAGAYSSSAQDAFYLEAEIATLLDAIGHRKGERP